MIFAALVSALPGFLLRFVGEGALEKVLTYRKDLAASANELEKVKINADAKAIEFELQRRAMVRDLQLREYEHPFLWWPKALIMMAVALYIFARFTVKTWGLGDYQIAVADLDTWEAGIASAVMAYLFLGGPLTRAFKG